MAKRTQTDWISNSKLAIHAIGNTIELFNGVTGEVSAIATIVKHGKSQTRIMPITGVRIYETEVTYEFTPIERRLAGI